MQSAASVQRSQLNTRAFRYTLIPEIESEPIVTGTVVMVEDPTPDDIRECVSSLMDGAFPQRVAVPTSTGELDMFFNSLGDMSDLQINQRATQLYHQHYLERHPETSKHDLLRLRGPVVLFDEPIWS